MTTELSAQGPGRCSPADRPEEHLGAKRRKIATSPQPSAQLCAQCQLLKLNRSFQRAHKFYASAREGKIPRAQRLHRDKPNGPLYYEDAFLVHQFKDRLAVQSECQLCTFFRAMRVQPEQSKDYKLLAFCGSESSVFCRPKLKHSRAWDKVTHTVFMAVVPDLLGIPSHAHGEFWLERDIPATGAIFRIDQNEEKEQNRLLGARELGERVDFSVLRDWDEICKKHHDEGCARRTMLGDITHGFRVIDCHKDPPVVEEKPWGTTYAALSYVWGDGLEEWPQTVLDAVTVTREMGLQYLWVDRLCIDQSSTEEKAYLISNMAFIYSEADFTIIVAAGSGANYGIPGVGTTPRKPQPRFEMQTGGTLISTLKDPRLEILESEWSKRGWTYQEGILSNRRLVFTDHQAYWECRCMAIHDSISLPLHLVHNPDQKRMADFMLGGIFKAISYTAGVDDDEGGVLISDDSDRLDYGFPMHGERSLRGNLRGLEEHIRAFSARKLSYDTDSLNALHGILSLLYNKDERMRTLLGIPIWMGNVAGDKPGAQITFALSLCSWYHRRDSALRLFASEPARRRPHLPSWTWAGWEGTVSWRMPPNNEHSAIMCNLIEVDGLDFLWAANLSFQNASASSLIRFADMRPSTDFTPHDHTLVIVTDPLILNYFTCRPTKHNWTWRRMAGRYGREQYQAGSMEWDNQWQRLDGRLVVISISLNMTSSEWMQKHLDGELVSVLVFAGRDPVIKHGRALFLTLRKVEGEHGRWERVGAVQLTVSDAELKGYRSTVEMLDKLPARKGEVPIIIQ